MKYKTSIAVAVIAGIMGFTGCASQPLHDTTRSTGRVTRSMKYSSENSPYYGSAVNGYDRNGAVARSSYYPRNNSLQSGQTGRYTRNLVNPRTITPIGRTTPVNNAPIGNKPATTVAAERPTRAVKPTQNKTHAVKRSTAHKPRHTATKSVPHKQSNTRAAATPSHTATKSVAHKPKHTVAKPAAHKPTHTATRKAAKHTAQATSHKPVHKSATQNHVAHKPAPTKVAAPEKKTATAKAHTPRITRSQSANVTKQGLAPISQNGVGVANRNDVINAGNNPYIDYGISRSSEYGLDSIANRGDVTSRNRMNSRNGAVVDSATRNISQNQRYNRNQNVMRTNPDGTINNRVRSFSDIGITADDVRAEFEGGPGPVRSGSRQIGALNGNPHIHYGISYGNDYGLHRISNNGNKLVAHKNNTRNGLPIDNATRNLSQNQQRNANLNVSRVNPDGTINNRVKSLEDIGVSAEIDNSRVGNNNRRHSANKRVRTQNARSQKGHNYVQSRRAVGRELATNRSAGRSGFDANLSRYNYVNGSNGVTRNSSLTRNINHIANRNVNRNANHNVNHNVNRISKERTAYRVDGIGMSDTTNNSAKLEHTVHRGTPRVIGFV